MKKLTEEELINAPTEVMMIYMNGLYNLPISFSTSNDAIEKYPEYFPEEVEYNNKWKVIPQEVHDNYWKEYRELDKEMRGSDLQPNPGWRYWIEHPDEFGEYMKKLDKKKELYEDKFKDLHDKYYLKYGIIYKK